MGLTRKVPRIFRSVPPLTVNLSASRRFTRLGPGLRLALRGHGLRRGWHWQRHVIHRILRCAIPPPGLAAVVATLVHKEAFVATAAAVVTAITITDIVATVVCHVHVHVRSSSPPPAPYSFDLSNHLRLCSRSALGGRIFLRPFLRPFLLPFLLLFPGLFPRFIPRLLSQLLG